MANRNVDKGREAENAVCRVLRAHGMPHAERRAKRGGTVELPDGTEVPADAGDVTGIPGVVVQVKWSGYKPLAEDMRRTDEQRRTVGAEVGLLVRKRPRVGCARAGEWDAYLRADQLAELLGGWVTAVPDPDAVWHTDLDTAARVIATAGYGDT